MVPHGLISVEICGREAVWVCVDPEAGDARSAWMLEHGWIDPPGVRLALDALRGPAADLHDGLFALAAAAQGAQVAASGDLVHAAAERNGFALAPAVDPDVVVTGPERLREAIALAPRVLVCVVDSGAAAVRRRLSSQAPLLVDPLRDRTLVKLGELPHDACALAVLEGAPPAGWSVAGELSAEQVRARLIDAAAAAGPPQPQPGPAPLEMAVRARGLSLLSADGRPVLTDADFHVHAGQIVTLAGAPPELAQAIAGLIEAAAGDLEVHGRAELVGDLADALMPGLSVAQNVEVLAAFLGRDVARADRRMARVAREFGFAELLHVRLADAPERTAGRVLLSAALDVAPGGVLVLAGELPPPDPALRHQAERHLRRSGATVIQLSDLVRPDRVIRFDSGLVAA